MSDEQIPHRGAPDSAAPGKEPRTEHPEPRPFGSGSAHGGPRPEGPAPVDAAFASLEKGLGSLFRVAETAVGSLKRELDKNQVTRDLERALGDAGREVVRATTNVASFVGNELTDWSKKVEAKVAGTETRSQGAPAAADPPSPAAQASSSIDWPTSREDYERRYGPIEGDWPRSPEEYEKRFGRKPKPSGPTDDDPGFTILGG
jgi:hypothetical protein